MKRINFASIQSDANIPCVGYTPMPVRTGYDNIVPYRVGPMFAQMAKDDGTVSSITPHDITITYRDGKSEIYPLGRMYGKDGSMVVPHSVVTELKPGDTLKKGDNITYNQEYFSKDPLDPSKLAFKFSTLATVAIMENSYTLEDGSMIDETLSLKLTSPQTKVRNIKVKFDQSIHRLVKPGDTVKGDDILCILEEKVTSTSNLFNNEDSLDILKSFGNQAPTAKMDGVIEKIEVYYNGKKEDMSPSLRDLVNRTDRVMLLSTKSHDRQGYTGEIVSNYLIDGNPVELNEAVIVIHITGEQRCLNGDKVVFSNQLKSTIGQVLKESPTAENGLKINAIFGARSINARIVNSPYILGTTNHLLVEIGKIASKMYRD